MSGSLIDSLLSQLQGVPVGQIAHQLGTDPATAQSAISAALPMIVGALGHNAQQPGGAGALLQALQEDHSGQGALGLGELLSSLTGGQGQSGGAGGGGGGGLGGIIGGVLGNLAGGQPGQGGALGSLGGLIGAVLGGGNAQNAQLNAGGILGHIFGGAQPNAQAGLGQASGLGVEKAGQLLNILAPVVMAHMASHVQANGLDARGLSAALGQERDRVQDQGGLAGSLLGAVLGRI